MFAYDASGLDGVLLVNGYDVIETSEGRATVIRDVEALHRALAAAVVDKPSPLTGAEFRFLRKEMELSQAALAGLLGIDVQAIKRAEGPARRKAEVQGPYDRLLRVLYRDFATGPVSVRTAIEHIGKSHPGTARLVLEHVATDDRWHAVETLAA